MSEISPAALLQKHLQTVTDKHNEYGKAPVYLFDVTADPTVPGSFRISGKPADGRTDLETVEYWVNPKGKLLPVSENGEPNPEYSSAHSPRVPSIPQELAARSLHLPGNTHG